MLSLLANLVIYKLHNLVKNVSHLLIADIDNNASRAIKYSCAHSRLQIRALWLSSICLSFLTVDLMLEGHAN